MLPETDPMNAPAPAVRALSCPNCGGSVELRAAGYTVHVGCQYCGSILDATNGLAKLVAKAHAARTALAIPLGTRGTMFGVEWEAIGYLQRSEKGLHGWEEYLLFNPYHGYRWLVNARGGWSFGTMLTRTPMRWARSTYTLDGLPYTRFFAGQAQVDRVVGEFYWRVAIGETVKTGDWVRPGLMLSREADGHEESWTLNRWLPEQQVVDAFGIVPAGPVWPPLPHEPSPWRNVAQQSAVIGAVALAMLLAISILLGGTRWITSAALPVPVDGREQTSTIGPVHLDRDHQRVRVRTTVPRLENGWVDLDYRLVDRRTQQVYAVSGAAERYSGADSDGPWTEGSRESDVSIAAVPAGDYDLVVDYKGNRWVQNGPTYPEDGWMDPANDPRVIVELGTGALYNSTIVLAAVLIVLPWLVFLLLHLRFDGARRNESDFTGND